MLTSQKKIRFENFKFFENFRNVRNNAHASIFDQYPLPRDASNHKPSKIIDFSCPEHEIHWLSLDFLVRTYLAQPPCLPGAPSSVCMFWCEFISVFFVEQRSTTGENHVRYNAVLFPLCYRTMFTLSAQELTRIRGLVRLDVCRPQLRK